MENINNEKLNNFLNYHQEQAELNILIANEVEEEQIEGDPWSVLKIKTTKYAKEDLISISQTFIGNIKNDS